MTLRDQLRASWWLLAALAIAFPLLRLLPLTGQFHIDWLNHEWLAAYSGAYLREHHTLPIVINTPQQAGMPYPVFYGTLFYPLLAILTTVLDAGVVFRVVAVALTALQLRLVAAALTRLAVPVWIARGVACLVIWAIYPMTNLYTRSAVPEYVATGLLTCVVASWFLLIDARADADRRRLGLGIGLMFTLAAGTHPITALYSLPVLALLLVAAFVEHGLDRAFWWRLARALGVPAVLAVVVLAPWLYALAGYQARLKVTAGAGGGPWFYAGIDTWKTRFSPIPLDPRTAHHAIASVSSPYLDAQVNTAMGALLLGWLVILLWRNRAAGLGALRAITACLIAFAFFTWISLYPSAFDLLPELARMLQIAYRAVTYQNIALLLAVLAFAAELRRRQDRTLFEGRPVAAGVLVACLALAAADVVVMGVHVTRMMNTDGPSEIVPDVGARQRLAELPATFYGADAYATPSLFAPLSAAETERRRDERIPMAGGGIGGTRPLRLQPPPVLESWVSTNIQAFPWNRVEVDGHEVADDDLRADGVDFSVRVAPGDHTVSFHTVAPATWRVLRVVSFAALALWMLLAAALTVRARRRPPQVTATASASDRGPSATHQSP